MKIQILYLIAVLGGNRDALPDDKRYISRGGYHNHISNFNQIEAAGPEETA